MGEYYRINNKTVYDPRELRKFLESVSAELAEIRTLTAELRTDMNNHVHGGVTAGNANTAAGPTISSNNVTQRTTYGS